MTLSDRGMSYLSRKFMLTTAVLTIASIALFHKLLSGGEWVTVSTLVLSAYKAASVISQRGAATDG